MEPFVFCQPHLLHQVPVKCEDGEQSLPQYQIAFLFLNKECYFLGGYYFYIGRLADLTDTIRTREEAFETLNIRNY